MFDRYDIVDEEDLARAVAKRFNGRTTARSDGAEVPVDQATPELSSTPSAQYDHPTR